MRSSSIHKHNESLDENNRVYREGLHQSKLPNVLTMKGCNDLVKEVRQPLHGLGNQFQLP